MKNMLEIMIRKDVFDIFDIISENTKTWVLYRIADFTFQEYVKKCLVERICQCYDYLMG